MSSIRQELLARALSVEAMLVELWQSNFASNDAVELVAVGGFGRAALFPRSDVDILLLLSDDAEAALTTKIQAFLADCWNLKLDMAASVRSASSASSFAQEDLNFMTSLLDARLLVGKGSLLKKLLRATAATKMFNSADFFAAKTAEQMARHERFADTGYNLEPNIKEGPGGLRDLHTIRWVLQRHFGHRHWADWVDEGFISSEERAQLDRVEAELSTYRWALHERTQRKEERLLFDHQIKLAEDFGYVDQGFNNRAVEQLMQRYFRSVREVQRLSEMLLKRFAELIWSPDHIPRALDGGAGENQWFLSRGQIEWRCDVQSERGDHILDFDTALRSLSVLAHELEAEGLSAQLLLQFHTLSCSELTPNPSDYCDSLLALLRAPQRVAFTLAVAARTGLLGRMIPAFSAVTGRMQYDLFHAYTVDQHTLFVLQKLEWLRSDEAAATMPLAHELWQRIRKPELLFLAALFHDIAKGRGGDHSELGGEDARRYGIALGLPSSDVELFAWLVEQHLSMSTTAQKKDIQDHLVVQDFARLVSDRERLEHLYLLTCADIMGTNPKLWNGWKGKLLADLCLATRFVLRQGMENPVHLHQRIEAARAEAMALLVGEGAGRAQVNQIWTDFPERALLRHSADELRFQTQAILAAQRSRKGSGAPQDVIAVRPTHGQGTFELFVRVPDRMGLFATIVCTLDRLGMSVLGARIHSTPAGFTHDAFQLLDVAASAEQTPRDRAIELQMQLQMALVAKELKPKVAKRAATRQQKLFQFVPQIQFSEENGQSRSDSQFKPQTLALICPDSFGLLARVAITLFEHKLQLHTARIATFGERVEDFFEVSEAQGEALNENRQKVLIEDLQQRLRVA